MEQTNEPNQKVLQALDNFTRAKTAINDHIGDNLAVFKAHETLVGNLITAQNMLEDIVISEKVGGNNGSFKVEYIEEKTKVFNEEKIRAALATNPELLAEVITEKVRPAKARVQTVRS